MPANNVLPEKKASTSSALMPYSSGRLTIEQWQKIYKSLDYSKGGVLLLPLILNIGKEAK